MRTRMMVVAVGMAFVLGVAGTATAGLTGYWPLDDGTPGTDTTFAFDDVKSLTDGTITEFDAGRDWYWTSSGSGKAKLGNAVYLAGDARLNTNRTLSSLGIDGNNARTISMWVRCESYLQGGQFLILTGNTSSSDTAWYFWVPGSDTLKHRWGADPSTVQWTGLNSATPLGTHVHWAFTYDGAGTMRIYRNGSVWHSYSTGALNTAGATTLIFSGYSGSTCPDATFDDLGVFNELLDTTRLGLISTLANYAPLEYTLGEVDQLFVGYDTNTQATIDGRDWYKFTGESGGTPGVVEDLGGGDYRVWFTATSGMGPDAPPSGPVPEPAGLSLLGLAALALRKKRS
jgi:hypothetical protein